MLKPASVIVAGVIVPVWMLTAPLPEIAAAMVWLTALETINVPSLAIPPTNVPEPSTPESDTLRVLPAAIAMRPVDVLVPVRKSVPAPEWVNDPVPEITPPNV